MDHSNIRITQKNVQSKGKLMDTVNINIPYHLAKQYNIDKSAFLEFEDIGDGIKIVPITFVNKFSS